MHHQDKLRRLPIPPLEESCDKFLETIKPILPPAVVAETVALVEDFKKEKGKEIDDKLRARESEPGVHSYLEEFWTDSYLNYRGSLPINVNPFFQLEEDPTPLRNSQTSRAASLVLSCLKFCQAIRTQTLEPDMWRANPMCMYQYPLLFGTCRVPRPSRDVVVEHSGSRHIVVISKYQFYWFDVMADDGKEIAMGEDTIAENLDTILEDSHASDDDRREQIKQAVGVLTALDRESWAATRADLLSLSALNEESLKIIESSILVLCLDDCEPMTLSKSSANFLHGTSTVSGKGIQTGTLANRWFDKTLQVIVCKNGCAGINFEHSTVDGHSVLRFASDVYTDTILRFAKTIRGDVQELLIGKKGKQIDSVPKKIVWKLNADIRHMIVKAEARLADHVCSVDKQALEFTGYGKRYIVKNGMSPDAFVQLIIQAAYFQVYGECVNTYETVQTKLYFHGRTEVARGATAAALVFAKSMRSDDSPERKLEHLEEALQAHTRLTKQAAEAKSFERHFTALDAYGRKLNAAAGVQGAWHPIFESAAWSFISKNIISTSNCGNPSLRLFGFGPVCQEGFGIGYLIKDDYLNFSISSFSRQTTRFVDALENCLEEMRQLLDNNSEGSIAVAKTQVGSIRLDALRKIRRSSTDARSFTPSDVEARSESRLGRTASEINRNFGSLHPGSPHTEDDRSWQQPANGR